MKISNERIKKVSYEENKNDLVVINNSIISEIDFMSQDISKHVVIENCIIDTLSIHSCWFRAGLLLKGNQIFNYVDYQAGGHNKSAIIIENNIFHNFFNFFDCHFEDTLEIKENIFLKGSNIDANKNEDWSNTFEKTVKFIRNIGNLNIDGIGL